MLIVQRPTSIARCTGAQVSGTSEYMHAIRTAHTSTSVTRTSGTPIAADTVGITTVAEVGITDVTGA